MPDLVNDYLTGKLKVDECKCIPVSARPPVEITALTGTVLRLVITDRHNLPQINEAFDLMKKGDCIR